MKTRLLVLSVLGLTAFNIIAAPLHIIHVKAPNINCLFNTNCTVTVNDTVSEFYTNIPSSTCTNVFPGGGGILQSRTFAGQAGTPEAGLYGYVYRLVLNKLVCHESITIKTMTMDFSPYSSFDYEDHPNKQIWVVTSGGVGSAAPSSAKISGTKITFKFNPPLVFTSGGGTETSSYFFGLVSATPPPANANGWATLTGNIKTDAGVTATFGYVMAQVRTP
jgi:hypothetical protein